MPKKLSLASALGLAIAFAAFATGTPAAAQAEKVLYSFNGDNEFEPGNLRAGVIFDSAGNLYGTTSAGGSSVYGTVFKLSPGAGGAWTESTIYNFGSYSGDGLTPQAGLVFDAAGNLYGTTTGGGANLDGTVFELSPAGGGSWTETILFSFDGSGGDEPRAGLVLDAAGNLYGTTYYGGVGLGVVFELSPAGGGSWTEQVLHTFSSTRDGAYPAGGVSFDAAGNLYGTTSSGGIFDYGTVFELAPTQGGIWTKTTLHAFDTGSDGYGPAAGVILDSTGNLYGTAAAGGPGANCIDGCGLVFELMPKTGGSWSIRILHAFDNNGKDGFFPQAGLVFDSAGNLYGTTFYGGPNTDCYDNEFTCGTVFELERSGSGGFTEKILHAFRNNASDGQNPVAPVILDGSGNLYGTTAFGGGVYGDGTVFKITP